MYATTSVIQTRIAKDQTGIGMTCGKKEYKEIGFKSFPNCILCEDNVIDPAHFSGRRSQNKKVFIIFNINLNKF